MPSLRNVRIRLLVMLAAILAMLAVLAALARSPYELTRIRNSLIASVGQPEDFLWPPGHPPKGFLAETATPPSTFQNAAREVEDEGPFSNGLEKALAIARHLSRGKHSGTDLATDTLEAYRRITSANQGHCDDYTQVFNGIAIAANLPVREWGMSFDGFSGKGHAFNEIYDEVLGKWVFVDSYESFYVVNGDSGEPLSVLEFREQLLSPDTNLLVKRIDPPAFGFSDSGEAVEYYRRGVEELFLWLGNNVFSYDSHPLVRFLTPLSRAAEQPVAIGVGIHPRILIYETPDNRAEIKRLIRIRWLFLGGVALFALLGLLTAHQLWLYRRLRRAPAPS